MNASPRHLMALALVLLVAACATPQPHTRYDVSGDIATNATGPQREVRALKLLRLAQAAMLDGKARESIDLYKQALTIYKDLGDFSAQAAIHNDLGLILNAAGQYDRALDMLQAAVELGARGTEKVVVIEALYNVAVVLYDKHDDAAAEPAYTRALDAARAEHNREMEGLALNGRGNTRRRANNLAPAIDDYKGALTVWNELRRPIPAAVALQNIGYSHLLRGESSEAINAFQQAINAFGDTQSADREVLVPHLEELMRMAKKSPDEAREKVLKVLGRE